MRDFLLVSVIALTVSQSLAVPKCPADGGASGDILLPNPADCSTYYMCLNGVPYLMPCSPGLHWSDSVKRCDYPDVANCEVTETNPTTESTTPAPTSSTTKGPVPDKCPDEDGPEDVLLPNPADCGSFFKCLNGVPHLISCPPGQHWSIALNRCDYPEVAQCVETETTVSTSTTSTANPPPRPDSCPEEDGPEDVLLPNPEDCGSFYKCLEGVPHLIPCPPGQHWSIALNRCDYPEIAKCEVKKAFMAFFRDSECPLHNEGYDVLLPNPEDCSTYFQCSNGVKILKECPVGTLWDAPMNRCDHKSIATCAE